MKYILILLFVSCAFAIDYQFYTHFNITLSDLGESATIADMLVQFRDTFTLNPIDHTIAYQLPQDRYGGQYYGLVIWKFNYDTQTYSRDQFIDSNLKITNPISGLDVHPEWISCNVYGSSKIPYCYLRVYDNILKYRVDGMYKESPLFIEKHPISCASMNNWLNIAMINPTTPSVSPNSIFVMYSSYVNIPSLYWESIFELKLETVDTVLTWQCYNRSHTNQAVNPVNYISVYKWAGMTMDDSNNHIFALHVWQKGSLDNELYLWAASYSSELGWKVNATSSDVTEIDMGRYHQSSFDMYWMNGRLFLSQTYSYYTPHWLEIEFYPDTLTDPTKVPAVKSATNYLIGGHSNPAFSEMTPNAWLGYGAKYGVFQRTCKRYNCGSTIGCREPQSQNIIAWNKNDQYFTTSEKYFITDEYFSNYIDCNGNNIGDVVLHGTYIYLPYSYVNGYSLKQVYDYDRFHYNEWRTGPENDYIYYFTGTNIMVFRMVATEITSPLNSTSHTAPFFPITFQNHITCSRGLYLSIRLASTHQTILKLELDYTQYAPYTEYTISIPTMTWFNDTWIKTVITNLTTLTTPFMNGTYDFAVDCIHPNVTTTEVLTDITITHTAQEYRNAICNSLGTYLTDLEICECDDPVYVVGDHCDRCSLLNADINAASPCRDCKSNFFGDQCQYSLTECHTAICNDHGLCISRTNCSWTGVWTGPEDDDHICGQGVPTAPDYLNCTCHSYHHYDATTLPRCIQTCDEGDNDPTDGYKCECKDGYNKKADGKYCRLDDDETAWTILIVIALLLILSVCVVGMFKCLKADSNLPEFLQSKSDTDSASETAEMIQRN
jgi:hypothetical protein